MRLKDKTILKKIISEIDKGLVFLGDTRLEKFLNNEMMKYAVAMTAINIGELVKNLTMEFREKNPQVKWKNIAGLRDIAAHKYETLDMNLVYVILTKDFPELKVQIEKILESDAK